MKILLNYLPRSSIHPHLLLLLLLLLILSPSLLQLTSAQQPSDSSSSDDYSALDSTSVNPTLAVVIIVVVLLFFMTVTFSFYIHHCSDSSSSSTTSSTLAAPTPALASKKGIEKSVIEAFPTFLYSEVKELKYSKESSFECAVCLNEFEECETLRLLPKCDHVFHSECIDAWLDGHVTCPVCRANLLADDQNINNNSQRGTHSHDGQEEIPSSGEVRIDVPQNGREAKETNVKVNIKRLLQRSHSTSDSLSRPGEEDSGRFTLKLPAEVRRQLLARSKLKRATSQLALPRASSSRRGYRGGGEGSGSSRYGGGIFGRSISRVVSFKWMPPEVVVREGLPCSSLPV